MEPEFRPSKPWWGAQLLLIGATAVAIYLANVSISRRALAGCGPEGGCNEVLSSEWAYWLNIPVSVPASATYLVLLVLTFALRRGQVGTRGRLWLGVLALSSFILAAAIWFVGLQLFVIERWCKLCLLTHLMGAGAAGILIHSVRTTTRERGAQAPFLSAKDFRRRALWSAALGWSGLVAGQLAAGAPAPSESAIAPTAAEQRDASSSARSSARRLLTLHGGQFALSTEKLPLVGSIDAGTIVVSLFDYTCHHCRAVHGLLAKSLERYSGRLAILSLPMPLDSACNPLVERTPKEHANACQYARLGLAVFRARPSAFREFDDWLFASDAPPSLDHARAKGAEMIGVQGLERALADPWVEEQIQSAVALYRANALAADGDTRIPQLMIGDVVVRGPIGTTDELFKLLERHTSLGAL